MSFLPAVALVGNTPVSVPDPRVAPESPGCPALPWRPGDGHRASREGDEWPGGRAISACCPGLHRPLWGGREVVPSPVRPAREASGVVRYQQDVFLVLIAPSLKYGFFNLDPKLHTASFLHKRIIV